MKIAKEQKTIWRLEMQLVSVNVLFKLKINFFWNEKKNFFFHFFWFWMLNKRLEPVVMITLWFVLSCRVFENKYTITGSEIRFLIGTIIVQLFVAEYAARNFGVCVTVKKKCRFSSGFTKCYSSLVVVVFFPVTSSDSPFAKGDPALRCQKRFLVLSMF